MTESGDDVSRRILQVHPTRTCNLRCLHCYSNSGPDAREALPAELIVRLLEDAVGEGYRVAGFSGGEPLLYPNLASVVGRASQLGMVTTVTTNGTRFTSEILSALHGSLSLLAISVDGVPASHNQIRASRTAFQRLESGMDLVRASGIPFGFIFTLTRYNLDELPWITNFALEQGASLLQIHPLEMAGRAQSELTDDEADDVELTNAYLLVAQLQEMVGEALTLQLDASERDVIRDHPHRFLTDPHAVCETTRLADYITPLVVESDGSVMPVRHGIDRRYSLGNLLSSPLPILKARWVKKGYAAFEALRANTRSTVVNETSTLPFLNWYDVLARRSALLDLDAGSSRARRG